MVGEKGDYGLYGEKGLQGEPGPPGLEGIEGTKVRERDREREGGERCIFLSLEFNFSKDNYLHRI